MGLVEGKDVTLPAYVADEEAQRLWAEIEARRQLLMEQTGEQIGYNDARLGVDRVDDPPQGTTGEEKGFVFGGAVLLPEDLNTRPRPA